tara:strand:+ start:254 stop:439 length:186 start_codon:yes stop_codon:yes gene_type:complete
LVTVDWDSDAPKLTRVVQLKFTVESYFFFVESFLGHYFKSSFRKGFEPPYQSVGRQFVDRP